MTCIEELIFWGPPRNFASRNNWLIEIEAEFGTKTGGFDLKDWVQLADWITLILDMRPTLLEG